MMNPLYNNRTYYIEGKESFDKLFRDIAYDGSSVQGTREFANTRLVISDVREKPWGLDFNQMLLVSQLLQAVNKQDDKMINEVYDSKYYLFLKRELEYVKGEFKHDCVATRRAVFQFPGTHCFDSIQVLIRDGGVIVTVNMRSCNAYKNLMCDIFLAQRLAVEAVEGLKLKGDMHIIVNIGSLHLFKEDIKNVL